MAKVNSIIMKAEDAKMQKRKKVIAALLVVLMIFGIAGAVLTLQIGNRPDTAQSGVSPEAMILSEFKPIVIENIAIHYNSSAFMHIGGKSYDRGMRISTLEGARPRNAVFYIEGKYTRLTGSAGFDDSSPYPEERVISFYGDDRFLGAVTVRKEGLPQPVDLNVTGVELLRICIDARNATKHYDVNLVNVLVK
jgi:hypothetical protein